MKKPIIAVAAIVGVVFLIIGFIYFTQPAGSLPGFFPGFKAGDMKDIHHKHALGSIALAVACFVYAWFQSGPKPAGNKAK